MNFPLINIDSALSALPRDEITAQVVDAYVSAYAYKNFDGIQKRLPFVLELSTHDLATWKKLVISAPRRYWSRQQNQGILVFDATVDCGFTRTYRYRPRAGLTHKYAAEEIWTILRDEDTLYEVLDMVSARCIFNSWTKHKDAITDLPTEFVTGRLKNTSVEKAVVFSKGDGCVVCGAQATCYAATTTGTSAAALLVQLPVCKEHLEKAKSYPTIFEFLVSLFQLKIEWSTVQKLDAIPNDCIPLVHELVATDLGASVGQVKRTARGWELEMSLPTGWRWLLRVNTFTDFCYLLFEPDQKKPAYKADSAPHHTELKFFPNHEHLRPDRKSDRVSPSFLYGHPLFDLKRLKAVSDSFGA